MSKENVELIPWFSVKCKHNTGSSLELGMPFYTDADSYVGFKKYNK